MNKKIMEMARDICHLNVSCDECTMFAKQMGQSKERYCKAMQYAKRAYEKGYRKQSEVIEEYRKKVYSKMEKYTVFGREYIQRIMREAEKEMKGGE